MLNLIKSINSAMLGPGPAAPLRAVGWMRAMGLRISRYINYAASTRGRIHWAIYTYVIRIFGSIALHVRAVSIVRLQRVSSPRHDRSCI
jgi:hypothetical protein